MKILLTNHHLLNLTGTEIYTYTLAKFLKKYGHQVSVYSPYLGNIKKDFEALDIPITNQISTILNEKFDIAHVHHHINAVEIRYYFPNLPIVIQIHGLIHFFEQLPIVDLKISHYLTVAESIKEKLIKQKIKPEDITISRNLIDSGLFKPLTPINNIPKKAMVISNYLPTEQENNIRQACQKLNIKCQFFGARFKRISQSQIAKQINNSDIIFSLGRGAMEAMFCGRIPFVYDYEGGDGLVTPQNFHHLASDNFSGRIHSFKYTPTDLILEIKKYNPIFGNKLHSLAFDYFDADSNTQKLIGLYSKIISQKEKITISPQTQKFCDFFVQTISETRNFSRLEQSQYFLNKQPYKFLHQIKKCFTK